MKKLLVPIFVIGTLFLFSSIEVNAQVIVKVKPAPPSRPKVVIKPSKPGSKYIWIKGYHRYDPKSKKYILVKGHWEVPPQKYKKAVWMPGHWKKVRGGFKWMPGQWKRK